MQSVDEIASRTDELLQNDDLEEAVRRGILTREVETKLRNLSAERRSAPSATEERFVFVDGLADVMSAVGVLLLLGAAFLFLVALSPLFASAIVVTSWRLANHFTLRRRLLLTSFALFAVFTLASALTLLGLALPLGAPAPMQPPAGGPSPVTLPALGGLVIAVGLTLACAAWWARFRLPIAVAVGAVAATNAFVHILRLLIPSMPAAGVGVFLLGIGLLILAVALWWDLSDVRRETKRADVAFWLHAAAGYHIAGAGFRLLFGVVGKPVGWDRLYYFTVQAPDFGTAAAALLLFGAFVLIAVALDRRSLVLSSLAFIFPALAAMSGLGGVGSMAISAMLIGTLLLFLSGFWLRLRVFVLDQLPLALRAQLPRTDITHSRVRPVL